MPPTRHQRRPEVIDPKQAIPRAGAGSSGCWWRCSSRPAWRELRQTVSALEGELFTTRTALDAYELRFSEVRDSVGSLKAQLEQLNALVNADPLAEPAAPDSPARARWSNSSHPARMSRET